MWSIVSTIDLQVYKYYHIGEHKENQFESNMGKSKSSKKESTSSTTIKKRQRKEVQVVVCPSAFPDFTTVGGSTARRKEQQRRGGSGIDFLNSNKGNIKHKEDDKRLAPALDVQETIREIHKFGAEGFTGKQKKSHEASEYERLTGREIKRHKMPTKIVVGMRAKAMKREAKLQQELKESGVVSHYSATNSSSTSTAGGSSKKKRRKQNEEDTGPTGVFKSNRRRNKGERRNMSSQDFGPTPSVGFMHKGMLKVKPSRR